MISIFQAYFKNRIMKNLSICELQIEKHYAYKKNLFNIIRIFNQFDSTIDKEIGTKVAMNTCFVFVS